MMNFLPLFKGLAGMATSIGAGVVVGNAIKATTPTNLKTVGKIAVGIGGVALSSLAGDLAASYVENQIEEIAEGFRAGQAVKADIRAAKAAAFKATTEPTPDGSESN